MTCKCCLNELEQQLLLLMLQYQQCSVSDDSHLCSHLQAHVEGDGRDFSADFKRKHTCCKGPFVFSVWRYFVRKGLVISRFQYFLVVQPKQWEFISTAAQCPCAQGSTQPPKSASFHSSLTPQLLLNWVPEENVSLEAEEGRTENVPLIVFIHHSESLE